MKTVETDYFVSRLLSLEETILNLSSFGCIFTFPFWILGTYFIYTTMCKVNKKLALINTFCISYSLLMCKHSNKCTFYTLRFGCSFAAVNTIKPQLL